MTEHRHLKALVRARMARTGESYTAARRHIVERRTAPGLTLAAEFRAHDRHCMAAVFTPDDARIVSGGFGGQARVWTLDGGPAGDLVGHAASVNVVRVSPDGATVVTGASDRTVRVWDLPTMRERAVLSAHRRQVVALDLDATRDHVWGGGHDGRLEGWALSTTRPEATIELGGPVTSLAVRPTDGILAVAVQGRGVMVLDPTGAEVARVAADRGVVGSMAWAADGSFLLASGPEGATVWASDGWEPVRSFADGMGGLLPVALSPDGSRVALGWEHHIGLWSADESEPGAVVGGLPKGVYGLSFSHDGRWLASASADGRVRRWSVS